jgi:pimeloyl-ACP methyl ester carboxylesterase
MKNFTRPYETKRRPRKRNFQIIAAVLVSSLLFSCGAGSDVNVAGLPASQGDLVDSGEVATIDATSMNLALTAAGLSGASVTTSITCYKLTYYTPDASGELIVASGLVCLPGAKSGGNPVLSYQHGTIFQDRDAPSRFLTSKDAILGAVFAALGYIAVLPDYVGYGDSTDRLHPYVHADTLASATVDMNRAARKFLAQAGFASNGQLFLAGYSEGGYATLATQRLMEQKLASEFPVTASEPGAGPYDLTGTTLSVLGLPSQPQPAFTGFLLKSYDSLYNSPSQLTSYFSATYAGAANTYFGGGFTKDEISTALGGKNVSTSELFKPGFLASYLGSGETALKGHIRDNDIYDWAPAVPTRLFHGVDDDTVPYANATTAMTAMIGNGSTSVSVVDCDAGGAATTHENCGRPYALDMIAFFSSLSGGI